MHRTAWLFAFALTALACVSLGIASLAHDRRAALAATEAKLGATARLLGQHAERALEAGDGAVRAAILAAGDPDGLREEHRLAHLHGALRGLIEGSPHLASLWVMDAGGLTLADSWSHPTRVTAGFAHRPYFQAHRQGERGLHVGPLAIGPISQRARFTLSRPLLTEAGAFAGVVATAVFSDYFAGVFAEAGLGEGALLILSRADGRPLALWPVPEGATDASLAGVAMAPAHDASMLTATRRLDPYPVVLHLGVPRAKVLAPWRARALASGAAMLGVAAAVGGLILLGLRGARQERALVATLEAERAALERRVAERTRDVAEGEARLRDTLESMNDAYVALDHGFRVLDINTRGQAMDGRPAEAILGRTHWEAWPASVGTPLEAAYRRAMAERVPVRLEHRYVDAAHDIWLDIRAFPTATGLALFYADVTERKRNEARTAEALAELRTVYDTAPIGLCVLDAEGRFRRINARLAEINGLAIEAHIGRTVREILPGIADAAETLHRLVMESGEAVLGVEIVGETPARPGEQRVWEEHWHPLRDAAGRTIGVNVVAEEVTERKAAEQRQLLLAREVDHRAKNALTMVQSVLRLTRAEDPKSFAQAVEGRVAALARAQGLAAEVRWTGVDLRTLLGAELSAFLPAAGAVADAPGLHVEGPTVTLLPAAAQPISMIAHELATNATKYGALSVTGGRVALSWRIDAAAGMLRLRWAEAGGPAIGGPPARRGFGSRVIEALVETQLGGMVTRAWGPGGLVCDIAVPLARAVRTGPLGTKPAAPAERQGSDFVPG